MTENEVKMQKALNLGRALRMVDDSYWKDLPKGAFNDAARATLALMRNDYDAVIELAEPVLKLVRSFEKHNIRKLGPKVVTFKQRSSLLRVYLHQKPPMSYREFRKSAFRCYDGILAVKVNGMVIGIERDGYAHT